MEKFSKTKADTNASKFYKRPNISGKWDEADCVDIDQTIIQL